MKTYVRRNIKLEPETEYHLTDSPLDIEIIRLEAPNSVGAIIRAYEGYKYMGEAVFWAKKE
jgi:hypothetical protein